MARIPAFQAGRVGSIPITRSIFKCVEGIIFRNHLSFRESAVGVSRYRSVKKSHSRAERLKSVSCYGLPRYHGRKLVRALMSDRLYGNQGGTAKDISSLRLLNCSLRDFLLPWTERKVVIL